MFIKPAKRLEGTIEVPGDKSISHRAAIVAAMADGESRIQNFAPGEDCAATLRCLRQLGVRIDQFEDNVWIMGLGRQGFRRPDGPLDCGNSGTTMRLLSGLLAGQPFESVLTGDSSLSRRPMSRVIEPLAMMGARIESNDGLPPLTIRGRAHLEPISYVMPVASAQVKSCVLLAALNAAGETEVIERVRTRDHTERMLRRFGAGLEVVNEEGTIFIRHIASPTLLGQQVDVPGDISSAVFFIVAAAVLNGSEMKVTHLGANYSRSRIISLLRDLGADIELSPIYDDHLEAYAHYSIRGRMGLVPQPGSNKIRGGTTAQVIDEIPALAVLGTQVEGGIEVRDARELRIKESDRIAAIVENLRRMGADVEEFDDGLRVGRSRLKGAVVDSFGDHRVAMSVAIAGLFADGETEISGADCIGISYPAFFETLASIVKH